MIENMNVEHLSNLAAEGSRVFADYFHNLDKAIRSTEGKAVECTKIAYEYGVAAFKDTEAFQAVLTDDGIQLKGGYNADNHFLAVTKLLATLAKVPFNSGEISRIAAICLHAYESGVSAEELAAYIEQVGGIRKAYDASVDARRSKGAAEPRPEIDKSLHIRIYTDGGFQGSLNVTPDFVAKLIRKWGVEEPGTDGFTSSTATNDNAANAKEVTHG
ncbi:protein of unknown function [Magnetospirillum gryphiswaldense MSR-1 v2]|uniref:Uncharacterized protein n=2 Tax=Magnetospirillum gryphiswaldense TaxID=55518 RepID=V6F4D8_MAGGM|nr:protein of unknown function [Magnetospirillum gryphiswaldense MSR-1 v2]